MEKKAKSMIKKDFSDDEINNDVFKPRSFVTIIVTLEEMLKHLPKNNTKLSFTIQLHQA